MSLARGSRRLCVVNADSAVDYAAGAAGVVCASGGGDSGCGGMRSRRSCVVLMLLLLLLLLLLDMRCEWRCGIVCIVVTRGGGGGGVIRRGRPQHCITARLRMRGMQHGGVEGCRANSICTATGVAATERIYLNSESTEKIHSCVWTSTPRNRCC